MISRQHHWPTAKSQESPGGDISRRDLFRTSGAAATAGLLSWLPDTAVAAQAPSVRLRKSTRVWVSSRSSTAPPPSPSTVAHACCRRSSRRWNGRRTITWTWTS